MAGFRPTERTVRASSPPSMGSDSREVIISRDRHGESAGPFLGMMGACPIGTCRLCLTSEVELQFSHLMPAGIYRIIADRGTPVLVSRETAVATSRQVRAHLLCTTCEQRFSQRGEDWVVRNCWRSPEEFRLRDGLVATEPTAEDDHNLVYLAQNVPDLRIERFVYFGLSVFWRAAVHKWSETPGDQVDLAGHENSVRTFLTGEQRLPHDIVLLISLGASSDQTINRTMTLPWLAGERPFRQFRFDIPGVTFSLLVGPNIPLQCVRTCAAHRGLITICDDADASRLETARDMVTKAEVKGKLKEHPKWRPQTRP